MFVFFLANMDGLYSSARVGVSMRRNVLKRGQLQHLLVWENHSRCKLHLVPHNYFGGPEDRRTRGPKDRRTRRPEVPGTGGPEDQRTTGPRKPEDQRTRRPEDQRTRGPDPEPHPRASHTF